MTDLVDDGVAHLPHQHDKARGFVVVARVLPNEEEDVHERFEDQVQLCGAEEEEEEEKEGKEGGEEDGEEEGEEEEEEEGGYEKMGERDRKKKGKRA